MWDRAPPWASDSCCLFWNLMLLCTFSVPSPYRLSTLHHSTPRQRTDGCLHGSELHFRGTAHLTVRATFPPVWPHTDHPLSPLLARTLTSVPHLSPCAQVPVVHLLFAFLSTLGGAVYSCGFWWEETVSGHSLMEKCLRNRFLFLLVSLSTFKPSLLLLDGGN